MRHSIYKKFERSEVATKHKPMVHALKKKCRYCGYDPMNCICNNDELDIGDNDDIDIVDNDV